MKDMLGKSGFDVIGDVHGHAAELTILFKRMGYQETNGVLRHPEGRRVVFLGDFIDRGPEIRRTLEIVRGMVEAGSALAVMGNHELNALHYTMPDPVLREEDGGPKWLRSHSESHRRQFEETVRQLGADLDVWLAWIRTLPVWMKTFDSEGVELRFVHAAWMETKMRRLWEEPTDSGELRFTGPFEAPVLTQAGLVDFGRRKDPVSGKPALGWKYKEKFLTGPEKGLPAGVSYLDKEGCERTSIRVKWWMDPAPDATLGDMIMAGRRAVAGLGDAVSVPWRGLKFKDAVRGALDADVVGCVQVEDAIGVDAVVCGVRDGDVGGFDRGAVLVQAVNRVRFVWLVKDHEISCCCNGGHGAENGQRNERLHVHADPPLSQVGSGRTRTNPLFSGNRTVRALFLYRRTEV